MTWWARGGGTRERDDMADREVNHTTPDPGGLHAQVDEAIDEVRRSPQETGCVRAMGFAPLELLSPRP